jgi:RNA polymerase sigma-70 factor (ECF subfamily)
VRDALPVSPGAWLTTTARRKALDWLRHLRIVERKQRALALSIRLEQEAGAGVDAAELSPVPDDQLRLIFTCCPPALSQEAQVALTLRTLGGLAVGEIAPWWSGPNPTRPLGTASACPTRRYFATESMWARSS